MDQIWGSRHPWPWTVVATLPGGAHPTPAAWGDRDQVSRVAEGRAPMSDGPSGGGSRNEQWSARGRAALVANYRPPPVALEHGEGCRVFDADGNQYLDLMGGIATAVLGHCHPRLVAALEQQARRLWHVSNLFVTEPQIELAERLVRHSFADRVFFANSGGEANEAALKLARKFHRTRGDDRFEIVAFEGGFHGRTLFTVSATGTPAYWEGFEPMVPGVRHAPYGDLDATKALVGERTAAIIVEPIQGEGGIRPAPEGFLAGLRRLADESGCLLIFDEIQTGMGRTGTLWAHEACGVTPDVMTLAKALGNGIPVGALCTRAHIADALAPGSHGSTFGGNPLACACAVAVLDELLEGGVLERSREVGLHFGRRLEALGAEAGSGRVVETRGAGFLRGIELAGPAAPVVERCRENGVLVITAGANVVRLAPPLVITREELDSGLDVLREAILAL
jgi:acetylornithine/N-succinyldiaminopimelate aminotransferase